MCSSVYSFFIIVFQFKLSWHQQKGVLVHFLHHLAQIPCILVDNLIIIHDILRIPQLYYLMPSLQEGPEEGNVMLL